MEKRRLVRTYLPRRETLAFMATAAAESEAVPALTAESGVNEPPPSDVPAESQGAPADEASADAPADEASALEDAAPADLAGTVVSGEGASAEPAAATDGIDESASSSPSGGGVMASGTVPAGLPSGIAPPGMMPGMMPLGGMAPGMAPGTMPAIAPVGVAPAMTPGMAMGMTPTTDAAARAQIAMLEQMKQQQQQQLDQQRQQMQMQMQQHQMQLAQLTQFNPMIAMGQGMPGMGMMGMGMMGGMGGGQMMVNPLQQQQQQQRQQQQQQQQQQQMLQLQQAQQQVQQQMALMQQQASQGHPEAVAQGPVRQEVAQQGAAQEAAALQQLQMQQAQLQQAQQQMALMQQQAQLQQQYGAAGASLQQPMMQPQLQQPAAVQQQQATASLDGQIVSQGWPPTTGFVGQRIRSLELTVGNVRNDVLVAKSMVGRLIGTGGSMYKELQTKTGAQIFILDKEGPPPGQADDMRIVVVLGSEAQVSYASHEISSLIDASQAVNRMRGGGGSGHPGGKAFQHVGKSYGTHDWSGVGMGPAPMFDVTQMPPETYAGADAYTGAGPQRGVKRQADEQQW